ncbi:MAG TPA: sigma-54 dependent transcriptional regulator [Polyangiales bacterium]|nr:sigma-54 dependent transcriptional regulator [Polyangiales bacterium]
MMQEQSIASLRSVASGAVSAAARTQVIRRNPAMLELERLIERLAPRPISVLVLGETGSGKELVARELHARSSRARGPLKIVNCAAIPESLTESVLFGHVRGAFTSAHRDQPGMFTLADGGTIFLDEVGELSSAAQAALLRVLDTHTLCPVGATQEQRVDVRVIAATHRDLAALAQRGQFRLDLYHRLNGVVLDIPPLRERACEIVPLFEYFLESSALAADGCRPALSAETVSRLLAYTWPGNVRELRNVAERALALCDGTTIEPCDLPAYVAGEPELAPDDDDGEAAESDLDLRESLRRHEVAIIREALRRTSGNQRRAAALLRVPLRTLERKLRMMRVRARA